MLHVLLSTLLFFQLLSDIAKQESNSSKDPSSDDDFISTKSFRTNDVPKSTMVIPTCRRTASRSQCYLLLYFKMNDEKQTSCFLICFCCISLQISFFFTLNVYIYHSFSGKNFSLKKRSRI